jgi:hypothetical protein
VRQCAATAATCLARQASLSATLAGLKIAAGASAAVCLVLDRGAGDKKGARAPSRHREDCSSPISQRWSHGPERESREGDRGLEGTGRSVFVGGRF